VINDLSTDDEPIRHRLTKAINDERERRQEVEVLVRYAVRYVCGRSSKGLGRFRSPPWSSTFEAERSVMGDAIGNVWLAWDESDEPSNEPTTMHDEPLQSSHRRWDSNGFVRACEARKNQLT